MKLTKADKAKQASLMSKMVDKPYVEKTRLSMSQKDLPDIKNWEVGKTYKLELKAKLVFKSEGQEWGDYGNEGEAKKTRATFEISNATSDNDQED